jgi:hypothetical protein
MSATRDKSQKTTFVYSNLYQLYRRGKDAAKAAPGVETPQASFVDLRDAETGERRPEGHVLKARDLRENTAAAPKVEEFRAPELIGKRIPNPLLKSTQQTQDSAIQSLKDNLKNLNDLHSRLRFMLQELEELVKE